MGKFDFLIEFRPFMMTGLGVIAFSNIIIEFFGQTIPNIVVAFFKDVGEVVVIAAVFTFAFAWLLRTRPPKKPKKYNVIIYDVFGNKSKIDGIRTQFKIHDVGWSYMKQYKKSYPLYNFALVSEFTKSDKQIIYRYL